MRSSRLTSCASVSSRAVESPEITTEEGTLIKEVCGESLTAGGYGQVYELIEGGV